MFWQRARNWARARPRRIEFLIDVVEIDPATIYQHIFTAHMAA
jgi:hypothetical protein